MIYEGNGVYYSPHKPLEYEPFELLTLSEPNYPDFDLNSLPWYDMPSYVQEIITAEPQGLAAEDSGEYVAAGGQYKIPFVCVLLSGEVVHIMVGYNLSVGSYFRTSAEKTAKTPYWTWIVSCPANANIYKNSVCYHAYYSMDDLSLTQEWKVVEPILVGENFVRYLNLWTDNPKYDYYFYGANALYQDRDLETRPITTGESYPQYVRVHSPGVGFQSGKITAYPDAWAGYIAPFTPPTPEQYQSHTSKGIWETLKSIPDMIGEKLKSLFIPADGFFDTYTTEFQEYFKDRFGLLYEIPDAVIGVLQQFVDYSPAEEGYSIHFPEVVMPVLDDGEWYDQTLIEERDITFEFLEQGAFKTLYSMYRSVIWMIFIFALINLIIRKSERVFGGSSG